MSKGMRSVLLHRAFTILVGVASSAYSLMLTWWRLPLGKTCRVAYENDIFALLASALFR